MTARDRSARWAIALAAVLIAASPALAQERGGRRGGPGGPPPLLPTEPLPADAAKIAWHGTWTEAQAEAKRTGRPILLVAAAPHCHNISGVW
jgi:hypothetical protein